MKAKKKAVAKAVVKAIAKAKRENAVAAKLLATNEKRAKDKKKSAPQSSPKAKAAIIKDAMKENSVGQAMSKEQAESYAADVLAVRAAQKPASKKEIAAKAAEAKRLQKIEDDARKELMRLPNSAEEKAHAKIRKSAKAFATADDSYGKEWMDKKRKALARIAKPTLMDIAAAEFPPTDQLVYKPFPGTIYSTLEPLPGLKKELTLESRCAIAACVTRVGPMLPRYQPKLDESRQTMSDAIKESRAKLAALRLAERKAAATEGDSSMATKKKAAKKTAKPAAKKTAKAAGPKKPGIGAFCEGMLAKGKDTETILAAVKKAFPGATTKAASIAWYRNKMREEGTLK